MSEPLAMDTKFAKSFVVYLPLPSATFAGTRLRFCGVGRLIHTSPCSVSLSDEEMRANHSARYRLKNKTVRRWTSPTEGETG